MDISKIILIYVCIAIACVFWRPDIVLGDSKQSETVLNFFNIDLNNYQTLNNINLSSDGTTQSSSLLRTGTDSQGSGNIFLTIVDGLFNALGYVTLLFRAIFSPIIIMTAGAFPIEITYFLGVPLVLMFIVSIIRFVRGY